MATYGAWLKSGADRADEVGELARWVMANTSRLGSPASIAAKITELASEEDGTRARLTAAHVQAKAEYDGQRGGSRPLAAVPDQPQEQPEQHRELTPGELAAWQEQVRWDAAGQPGMQAGAEQLMADALDAAAYAAPDTELDDAGLDRLGQMAGLTGNSPADLDDAYRRATGQEPPPYEQHSTLTDADRELADSRRLVWIELALRMALGDQRAAEIDAVMDAALGAGETDLVASYATADLG